MTANDFLIALWAPCRVMCSINFVLDVKHDMLLRCRLLKLLRVRKQLGGALLRNVCLVRGIVQGVCVVIDRHRVDANAFDQRFSLAVLLQHLVSVDRWLQLLQFFEEPLILVPDLRVSMLLLLHIQ